MPDSSSQRASNVVRLEPRQLGLGEVFFLTREAVVVGEAESGRIVVWNDAAVDLFGYTEDEAVGLLIEDLVPDELKQRHRAGLAGYGRNGRGELIDSGTTVEVPAVRQDGSGIWVEMSLTPIEPPGHPGRYVMAIVRNITERKQLEAAVERTQQELSATVRELERRTAELTLMNELGDLLHSCTTIDDAADVIGQIAQRLFTAESGALYLFAASRNALDAIGVWGPAPPLRQPISPIDCWALRRGRPHVVGATHGGVRCAHVEESAGDFICVPMIAQGEALGLFHLRAGSKGGSGIEVHRDLALAVAEHLALALANFRLRETLRHQSIRDPLTNLYNRRFMEEALEREVRRATRHRLSLAVIAIDIDHFKRFNDTYGHESGDTLLRNIAGYLGDNVRSEDVACRHGGEEFLLILPYASLDQATERAQMLCEGVRGVTVLPRGAISAQSVTISLGVATVPIHADNAADLVRAADQALYRAKQQGRDRVVVAGAADDSN